MELGKPVEVGRSVEGSTSVSSLLVFLDPRLQVVVGDHLTGVYRRILIDLVVELGLNMKQSRAAFKVINCLLLLAICSWSTMPGVLVQLSPAACLFGAGHL